MSVHRGRPVGAALSLVVALLGTAGPTVAVDPTPQPSTAADEQPPTAAGTPSAHSEMLAEHAGDAMSFAPGSAPEPLAPTALDGGSVAQDGGTGGIAGLPNGLSHEVFGYLPYWVLSSSAMANLDYDLVSTIAYFSVGARSDGTLEKSIGGTPATGWAGWNSSAMTDVITAAHRQGVKVVLTVTMMAWDGDYRDFTTLLTTTAHRNRLARQIARAVAARNADGVNLDFEPMPNSLESAYTRFVRAVKSALIDRGAGRYLTVAATGGAASWDEGYELVDNADGNSDDLVSPGSADAIMVMAYDFNWSGSARAGAVAPMDSPYVLDARAAMAAYLARVPASQIIWGIPYYGRAWTTAERTVNGRTCGSAGTCSAASWASTYVGARDAALTHTRRWDDVGKVPWYRYQSTTYDTWVQGYYDDPASLRVKYDFVKANRVRGIGIWHLLMDGSRRELWTTLAGKFGPPPFTDIAGTSWEAAIVWVYQHGIMDGCSATRFCPDRYLTRAQLAGALANALDLPATGTDYFADDNGHRYERAINRLRAAGLTSGCGGGNYCPDRSLRRGRLAEALDRALGLPGTGTDFFRDDDGLAYEGAINRVAAAGIDAGCDDNRFCPDRRVRREHAANWLRKAFD
jgi:spore germination protein YaaH